MKKVFFTDRKHVSYRIIKDKVITGIFIILSLTVTIPLFMILYDLFSKGYSQINFDFFTETTPNAILAIKAKAEGSVIPGGVANGIVGSFIIIGIASLLAIPIGVVTGTYLSELKSDKFSGFVRTVVEMLQGVPSIVLGIIGYIWIVKPITKGFSGFAAAVALSIMMLPSIIRTTEETLNMISPSLKEAAFSLGVPYWRVVLKVIIPNGFSGIITGIMLGISRIAGETAPLLLTALGSLVVTYDPTKPMSALPLMVWEFYNDPNLVDMIWSASLLLIILVLVLNIAAKILSAKLKN
ncbi:MAG: phosphate ABC transporter permease PstA [Candidatus Delongbacteria bacterium]|nr:phosphate ABC transporter permease PstA [Candidatus Delongbacteria bacterium]MBN2835497.1 phosphate ABC transporter permease PstA [Candidatus Delongbacteria bacterium]